MSLDLDVESFKKNIFEKVAAYLPNSHNPIVSTWDELDELLYAFDVNPTTVRLIRDKHLSESEFSERIPYYGLVKNSLNKERLYSELAQGATLVLNRVEMRSLRVKRLCNEIAHVAQGQVVANGYLAMTGSSAFGNHWDAHDVFATQLIGKKRWRIYRPTFNNPIAGQLSRDRKDECPIEAVIDVITRPGDILYIPRGWWHCAYPSEGPCFHLAIGVHKPYVLDYLGWLSANVLSKIEQYRSPITIGNYSGITGEMRAELAEIASSEEGLREFEKTVYYKEKLDGGLNLGVFFSTKIEALDSLVISLASPYADLVSRDGVYLNGVKATENLITSEIVKNRLPIFELRRRLPNISACEVMNSIKSLLSKGVIHISQ